MEFNQEVFTRVNAKIGDIIMEESGAEVLAIFSEFAGKDLVVLRQTKGDCHGIVCKAEQDRQEALDRLHAVFFVELFPKFVRRGVLDRIVDELEFEAITNAFGKSEMRQYLNTFRGKIIVYTLESTFQGRSNDDSYQPPRWVTYAIELLASQGWQVSIKTDVFADVGVGNSLNAYLCIPDPRPAKPL